MIGVWARGARRAPHATAIGIVAENIGPLALYYESTLKAGRYENRAMLKRRYENRALFGAAEAGAVSNQTAKLL